MGDITETVSKLQNKFKSSDPFFIANKLGIITVHEDLGNTLGYYSKHFRTKFIHINEKVSEKGGYFVCAHELGHALLHSESNTPFLKKNTFFSTEKIELEANFFAMHLLFSSVQRGITFCEFKEYGIPKELVQNYRSIFLNKKSNKCS
ncbi:ImmA/IrrE family metallo-endopeptidase [Bacillus safensis]|uniref:ImmA/IrrE family metallo-endopeptidase n=1 Tax=Bacillus safensis TaxID=561879 RepID=UPI0024C09E27|nr:ImmA/IrrE family metallo-endopeptidase [Bacillus safensis]WHX74682.1 ImmA/IrrE family metallo-endopeptidase [Bacillus safensis]WHX82140.1 ImmA/IrrE family metallo-endopeptidase [Bacillus safensis]